MASVMHRGTHARQLEPGIRKLFGTEYDSIPQVHGRIFEMAKSERAYEEDVRLEGMGHPVLKEEGAPFTLDSMKELYPVRYVMRTYGTAFVVTEEAIEDNLYGNVAEKASKNVARAMVNFKDMTAVNILNSAFDANFKGGDQAALISTQHPTSVGFQSNTLAVQQDLSTESVEDMVELIMRAEDDRGIKISLRPKTLIIPPELKHAAIKIMKSENEAKSTESNNVNALRLDGTLTDTLNTPFLIDEDAWFITTDCPDGMKGYNRVARKMTTDGDFDTGNIKHKCRERYVFGWSDHRGIYGCAGA